MDMVIKELDMAGEHRRKIEYKYVFRFRHSKDSLVAIGQSANNGCIGKIDAAIPNSLSVRLAVRCRNQPSLGEEDWRGPDVARRLRDKAQVECILAGAPRTITVRICGLARAALLHDYRPH